MLFRLLIGLYRGTLYFVDGSGPAVLKDGTNIYIGQNDRDKEVWLGYEEFTIEFDKNRYCDILYVVHRHVFIYFYLSRYVRRKILSESKRQREREFHTRYRVWRY